MLKDYEIAGQNKMENIKRRFIETLNGIKRVRLF